MLRGIFYLWKDIKELSRFELAVLVFVLMMFLLAILDSWDLIKNWGMIWPQ
jgi:hypothetical protein